MRLSIIRFLLRSIAAIGLVLLVLLLMASSHELFGQNNGAMMPWAWPAFPNASGSGPAANGFVCTTATGTTTPLATFSEQTLTTANANPITLNAAGRAVSGASEIRIFLQAESYRITVYAAGTGNTCNGTTVGTLIRQVDNVYDLAVLFTEDFNPLIIDNVHFCAQYAGATADLKMTAAIAAVPATGGTVDCRGLEGAQTISATVTINKPINLLLGGATFTSSANTSAITISSSNVGIYGMGPGATEFVQGAVNSNIIYTPGTAAYSGIVIQGIEFNGNDSGVAFTTDDLYGNCIRFDNITNSRIINNYIHDCVMNGLSIFNESNDNVIAWNRIEDIGKSGACPGACTFNGIFLESGSDRNKVLHNRINVARDFGIWENGTGSESRDNLYDGNYINGTTQDGIRIGNDDQAANNDVLRFTITNNTISGVTGATSEGIRVYYAGVGANVNDVVGGIIKGNHINGNAQHGVLLGAPGTGSTSTRHIVEANYIVDNTGDCVNIGTGVVDAIIVNNVCIGNGNAIIDNGTRTLISGNESANGGFRVVVNGATAGIIVTAASGSSSIIQLDQTSVANWSLINSATSGTLGFQLGGTNYFQIAQPSGNASIGISGADFTFTGAGELNLGSTDNAGLAGLGGANGAMIYCTDCTIASPCAGGGSGAIAKRINAGWVCN